MLYVKNNHVYHVSDLEIITDPKDIKSFTSVVEYRERGKQTLHSKRFEAASEALAFVDANRGVAATRSDGSSIPGKFLKLGNWDWFAVRPSWSKNPIAVKQ